MGFPHHWGVDIGLELRALAAQHPLDVEEASPQFIKESRRLFQPTPRSVNDEPRPWRGRRALGSDEVSVELLEICSVEYAISN